MTILYINDEHCTSMEQLRSYFEGSWSYESPVFCDLLDASRSGDISSWLREMGEPGLADKVDDIDDKLGDSEYFSHLSALMTGNDATSDLQMYEKPAFSKCFKVEDVRQEEIPTGIAVHVHLKVLSSVNETYEFAVRTSWGTKGDEANPFDEKKGGILTKSFTFRKRPNQDFKVIKLLADGIELEDVPCAGLGGDVLEFEVGSCRFNMIRVEGGTFTMGATPEQEEPCFNEKPAHQVSLSSYYIAETPVTQALWKSVMGGNPSHFKGDSLPVETVSWDDCHDFIQKLNKKTGKSFRLPTEAEWEFAARGGNKSRHTQYSGSDNIDEVAWYGVNSDHKTHPVKTKKGNELGIHDMSGNVWEWCEDRFGKYSSGAQTNPTGPRSGASRVIRGGGWFNSPSYCRSSNRYNITPELSYYFLGLRLVLSE